MAQRVIIARLAAFFSELCRSVYQRSGAVAGAIYDENQMVKHIVSDEPSDLERMRQSKYVQSEIDDVYQRVKERLGKGQTVLFSGCPCQVEGLLSVLGERHPNLYTVDLICRGRNSPKAYRKWLDMLETKFRGKVVRVWFRNKETGWNHSIARIDFDNGKVYRVDHSHNLFISGYLKHNLFVHPSCGKCPFKGLPRVGDITLGDFWGIDKIHGVGMGTSLIIVNNPHGKELLESAKNRLFLTERSLDEAVRGNKMIITSTWVSEHSGAFLQSLDSLPFDKAYRKIKPKLKAAEVQKSSRPAKKIKRVIRRLLSKLRG